MTAVRKPARLEMRLSREHKELLEQAAMISGEPLSAFVLSNVLARAREILAQQGATRLTRRDQEKLVALLVRPPAPTAALRRAMKRIRGLHA